MKFQLWKPCRLTENQAYKLGFIPSRDKIYVEYLIVERFWIFIRYQQGSREWTYNLLP